MNQFLLWLSCIYLIINNSTRVNSTNETSEFNFGIVIIKQPNETENFPSDNMLRFNLDIVETRKNVSKRGLSKEIDVFTNGTDLTTTVRKNQKIPIKNQPRNDDIFTEGTLKNETSPKTKLNSDDIFTNGTTLNKTLPKFETKQELSYNEKKEAQERFKINKNKLSTTEITLFNALNTTDETEIKLTPATPVRKFRPNTEQTSDEIKEKRPSKGRKRKKSKKKLKKTNLKNEGFQYIDIHGRGKVQLSDGCKEWLPIEMLAGMKHILVDKHNFYRNSVASGLNTPLPKATNIYEMYYTNEMEMAAYKVAAKCTLDDSVKYVSSENVTLSYNIYTWTGYVESNAVVLAAVKNWSEYSSLTVEIVKKFKESPSYNSFTQIIWATTVNLGCGGYYLNRMMEGGVLLCFYQPPGNIVDNKIYEAELGKKVCVKSNRYHSLCVYNRLLKKTGIVKNKGNNLKYGIIHVIFYIVVKMN